MRGERQIPDSAEQLQAWVKARPERERWYPEGHDPEKWTSRDGKLPFCWDTGWSHTDGHFVTFRVYAHGFGWWCILETGHCSRQAFNICTVRSLDDAAKILDLLSSFTWDTDQQHRDQPLRSDAPTFPCPSSHKTGVPPIAGGEAP